MVVDPERIQPLEQKILKGDSTTFTCLSKGKVYWYHNDSVIIFSLETTIYVYTAGYYECVGTREDRSLFRARGLLIIYCKYT